MTETALAAADRLLVQALDALDAVTETGADAELIAILRRCETAVRRLDRTTLSALAGLERRGVFARNGYKSSAAALADLVGWERFEARRRVAAAEQVTLRVGLDGAALPARLPATAAVFAAGQAGLRHVDAIARVLASASAQRLTPSSGPRSRNSWPARPRSTPRPSCTPGALRSWSCSTRTGRSPTTGRPRR